MRKEEMDRPTSVNLLTTALLLQGLSGILGGFGLMSDPTGRALEIPQEWITGTPFSDYFIPGLILFSLLGIGPLIAAYAVWKRHRLSWMGAMLVGDALVIWIVVEIFMIGYHSNPPLQLFYGLLGVGIIVLTLLPSVRRYLLAAHN
jgi:hypothetical protein